MRSLILLALILPGCVTVHSVSRPPPVSAWVPETIALEGGTSVRHEIDQPAVKQNTALVKVLWRLR